MITEKWNKLIERLEITEEEDQEVFSESVLSAIEESSGIKFPADYKQFCQTLGTGTFNDFISLFCPSNYLFGVQVVIEGVIKQLKEYPSRNKSRDLEYIQLLQSSFQFGEHICGGSLIVWDLRTYSEDDDSYDIYWTSWEMPGVDNPIKVGRDFFQFVQEFCLGDQARRILPDPEDACPEENSYTFARFKPVEWDLD